MEKLQEMVAKLKAITKTAEWIKTEHMSKAQLKNHESYMEREQCLLQECSITT